MRRIAFASSIAFLGIILLVIGTIFPLFGPVQLGPDGHYCLSCAVAREPEPGHPPDRPDSPPPGANSYDLYINYEYRGSGRIVGDHNINCNDGAGASVFSFNCGARIQRPGVARLTAVPANGWRFAGWQSGDGVCTGTNPTITTHPPPTGTLWTTCVAKFEPISSALAPWVPEFLATSLALTGRQEVGLGSPVTRDAAAGSIVHFQEFRDGDTSGGQITSYSPFFSSAEMHRDGCIFVAKTPETSPRWYNNYIAVDETPFREDWPLRFDGMTLATLAGPNRSPMNWPSVSLRYDWNKRVAPFAFTNDADDYGGPYPFEYAPAPRWYQLCVPPGSRPVDWTEQTLRQIPAASTPSVNQSGAACDWKTAGVDTEFGQGVPEWVALEPFGCGAAGCGGWLNRAVAGIVTNSYLSGEDATLDHAGPPDNYALGPGPAPWWVVGHWGCEGVRPFDWGNPFSVSSLTFTAQGQLCNDWEINVRVDPEYRYLLAPSNRLPPNTDCAQVLPSLRGPIIRTPVPSPTPDPRCGKGNQPVLQFGKDISDMGGNLGLEIEQWLIPVPYRPQPGDRIYAVGRWVVDCGHFDWHSELHPIEALQTWHAVPQSESAHGNPATETRLLITGAWQGGVLEFDVWPIARPRATASLNFTGTAELTEGAQIASEVLVPQDNPNHLHVRVTAPAQPRLSERPFGQVSYEPHQRLAKLYVLWWEIPAGGSTLASTPHPVP
jgi:hypothetical protein